MEKIAHGLCTESRISWSKVRPKSKDDETTFVIGELSLCFKRYAETHQPTHCEPVDDIRFYKLQASYAGELYQIFEHVVITEFLLYVHANSQSSLYTRYATTSVRGMAGAQFATGVKHFIFATNGELRENSVVCECKAKSVAKNGCQLCLHPHKLLRRTGLRF